MVHKMSLAEILSSPARIRVDRSRLDNRFHQRNTLLGTEGSLSQDTGIAKDNNYSLESKRLNLDSMFPDHVAAERANQVHSSRGDS